MNMCGARVYRTEHSGEDEVFQFPGKQPYRKNRWVAFGVLQKGKDEAIRTCGGGSRQCGAVGGSLGPCRSHGASGGRGKELPLGARWVPVGLQALSRVSTRVPADTNR